MLAKLRPKTNPVSKPEPDPDPELEPQPRANCRLWVNQFGLGAGIGWCGTVCLWLNLITPHSTTMRIVKCVTESRMSREERRWQRVEQLTVIATATSFGPEVIMAKCIFFILYCYNCELWARNPESGILTLAIPSVQLSLFPFRLDWDWPQGQGLLGQSVSALSHRILFFRFRLLNDTFVSIYGAVKAKSSAVVILRLCANLGHGWSTKIASAGGGRGGAKALKG